MGVASFTFSKKKKFEQRLTPILPSLLKRAYYFTQSKPESEDLVQNLLLKIYEKSDDWLEVDNIGPWMMKALYHLYVDDWRKTRRQPHLDQIEPLEDSSERLAEIRPDSDPEKCAEQDRCLVEVSRALSSLSEEHRALIVLHDVEGLSLPEIKRELGVPLGTLKSRLHRARQNLREKTKNMEPFGDQCRYEK